MKNRRNAPPREKLSKPGKGSNVEDALAWALDSEQNAATVLQFTVRPHDGTATLEFTDGSKMEFRGKGMDPYRGRRIQEIRSIPGTVLQQIAAALVD